MTTVREAYTPVIRELEVNVAVDVKFWAKASAQKK